MKTAASPEHLEEIVRHLSVEIGPRSYLECSRLNAAADYIAQRFERYNYDVSEQLFQYRKNTYKNIIACSRHTKADSRVIVVGAHYDTVCGSPGADDNASSVAGLLELAKLLSNDRDRDEMAEPWSGISDRSTGDEISVHLTAFALEEPPAFRTHDMGSYHYARSLKKGRRQVIGMICLEMIGYFTDDPHSQEFPLPFMERKFPSTGNFVAAVSNLNSKGFTEKVRSGFTQGTNLPVFSLCTLPIVIGIDFSDHWSFYRCGFPATMITDTGFYRNPYYHTEYDTWDTLDYKHMAEVVNGTRSAVQSML